MKEKYITRLVIICCAILFVILASSVFSAEDARYCGSPKRDANGSILRSNKVLLDFKKIHPCPATWLPSGACAGWSINHTIPLSCGGCDKIENLDWMPNDTKSCSTPHCRDRYERKIYAHNPPFLNTGACVNEIVK